MDALGVHAVSYGGKGLTMLFDPVLFVHIVSASVLFAAGMVTALTLFVAVLSGNVASISYAARRVVIADWFLTMPSGFIQFCSGVWLGYRDGVLPESWVVVSVGLFLIAAVCWVPVLGLQIRMSCAAEDALQAGETSVSAAFMRDFWVWCLLGLPAFFSLVFVFYLMVSK